MVTSLYIINLPNEHVQNNNNKIAILIFRLFFSFESYTRYSAVMRSKRRDNETCK